MHELITNCPTCFEDVSEDGNWEGATIPTASNNTDELILSNSLIFNTQNFCVKQSNKKTCS